MVQLVGVLQDAPSRQGDRYREAAQGPGPHAKGLAAEDAVERQARELRAAGEEGVEHGGGGDAGEAEGELGEVGEAGFAAIGEAAVGELRGAEGAAEEERRREAQGPVGGGPEDEFLEIFGGEGAEPGVDVGSGGAGEEEMETRGAAAVGGEDAGNGGGEGGGGDGEVGVEQVERHGRPEGAPAAG